MKKLIFFLFVLLLGATACTNHKQENATTSTIDSTLHVQNAVTPPRDVVQVLYFHGKQRCLTCNAIEKEVKHLLTSEFSTELNNKAIDFRIIDISKPENEQLVNRYEISWSSLLINDWSNGTEIVNNLTEFAFAKARNNPEEFRKQLTTKISESLKN